MHKRSTAALAFIIMLCLIALALLWGARKGWIEERRQVDSSLGSLEDRLKARGEVAANILAVAKRHLPPSEPLVQGLKADMEQLADKKNGLADKLAASGKLSRDALLLLNLLDRQPTLIGDSRDSMYVKQLLPQQLEQTASAGWEAEYNLQADNYNRGLENSFSGRLARLLGVDRVERLLGEAE